MGEFSWRVYGVCFFAAFGGLCFGYDTGVLSVNIEEKKNHAEGAYIITQFLFIFNRVFLQWKILSLL